MDLAWRLALRIEEATLNGDAIAGSSLDYAKCFDRIPHRVLFRCAERAGLHTRILAPLRGMYDSLTRRYRIGGGVGTEHACTNGLLQGCPLSPLLLNALVAVWARAVEAEAGVTAWCYADDTTTAAFGTPKDALGAAQRALDVTEEYEALTKQVIHTDPKKSMTFIRRIPRGTLTYRGIIIPPRRVVKSLGMQIDFGTEEEKRSPPEIVEHIEKKIGKAALAIRQVDTLPFDYDDKALVAAAIVSASVGYGCEVMRLLSMKLEGLRKRVTNVFLGAHHSRIRGVAELPALVCFPGHRLQPAMIVLYQRLATLRRMLKDPDTRRLFVKVWAEVRKDGRQTPATRRARCGPAGVLLDGLKGTPLTLQTEPDIHLMGPNGRVDFLDDDASIALHNIREVVRQATIHAMLERRNDPSLETLRGGIDKEATQAILGDKKRSNYLRGVARHLVCATVLTKAWCFTHTRNTTPTPTCDYCDGIEDNEHLFFKCPAWKAVRDKHPYAVAQLPRLPDSVRDFGVAPADWIPPGRGKPEAKRKRVTAKVQELQVAVIIARNQAREEKEKEQGKITVSRHREYPWDWSPPGVQLDLAFLHDMDPATFPFWGCLPAVPYSSGRATRPAPSGR
eukprot:Hpha_TRINITY_DN16736_c1_g1::TRINITY_DN16736_c1_g1_i1::g.78380::m.78380